jgi:hypothetical protein
MPAINFKAEFANQVKNLKKRQTIRPRGKRRPPRVGEALTLYTGMRTAACRKLADVVCTSVEEITISINTRTVQMPRMLGGQPVWVALSDDEIEALARADGFVTTSVFLDWFREQYGATFSGYVIKWRAP